MRTAGMVKRWVSAALLCFIMVSSLFLQDFMGMGNNAVNAAETTKDEYVITNMGTSTVTVKLLHYSDSEKIYSDDDVELVPGQIISGYNKAINWNVKRVVMVSGKKETRVDNIDNITVHDDTTFKIYYEAKREMVSGSTTFYDYVVRPKNEKGEDLPLESINTDANFPEGSQKNNRFSIGFPEHNIKNDTYNYRYETKLNGKDINRYSPGTGDSARKTGIIKGLSQDYKEVLFNVDEQGCFNEVKKAGKFVLKDYKLNFQKTGDSFTLESVNDPAGKKVATSGADFFPLDTSSSHVPDKSAVNHNYFFGMRYDIDFTLGDYVGPLNYSFTGDDDLWVILDGEKIVIDLGGIHDAISDTADLWDYLGLKQGEGATTQEQKTAVHRLTILYMERGAAESNCQMNFTIPSARLVESGKTLTTSIALTKVNTVGNALPNAVFNLVNDNNPGQSYTYTSDSNGKVQISELTLGEYTLKEIIAPNGYVNEGNTWKIKVVENGDRLKAVLYEADGKTEIKNKNLVNRPGSDLVTVKKTANLVNWTDRIYVISLGAYCKAEASEVNKDGFAGAKVADYISAEFDLLDDNGNIINQATMGVNDAGKKTKLKDGGYVVLNNGAKAMYDSTKELIYVVWENQALPYSLDGSDMWNNEIHVKAKSTYIGGNNVATNDGALSGVSIPDGNDGYILKKFEKPKVNVKIEFNISDTENTIFLGQNVSTDTSVLDNMKLHNSYSVDEQNGDIKYSDMADKGFEIYWYNSEKLTDESKTSLDEMSQDMAVTKDDKLYYLDALYNAGVPTDESNANSTVDGVVYANGTADNGYKVGSSNCGIYTTHVIDGRMTVKKEFEGKFLDGLSYTSEDKELIDARQTVEYTVYKYSAGTTAEQIKSGKATPVDSFNFTITDGQTPNNEVTVTGLAEGVYQVVENTDWSWKYNLESMKETEVKDGLNNNNTDGIFYIGLKFEENGVVFTNVIDEVMKEIYSDTTNVLNIFKEVL